MTVRSTSRAAALRTATNRAAATLALSAAALGLSGGVAAADTESSPTPISDIARSDGSGRADGSTDGEVDAAYSRGAIVTNMSGNSMRLRSVEGDQWFEGRPGDGAVIKPGQEHRWEVQLQYMRHNNNKVTYDLIRPDGSRDGEVVLHMYTWLGFLGEVGRTIDCVSISSADGLRCSDDGNFVITDRPGTVRTMDGSGPNAVAIDVLQNLCETGRASCEFNALAEKEMMGTAKQIGSRLANPTDIQQSKSVQVTDAESASDSLGGSMSLKVPIAPVELTVQLTYNHTWTRTHTFAETTTVNVPPKHWGWIEQRTPFFRHTGDFVVTTADTTWIIKNVSIDSPDPDRPTDMWTRTEPMTPDELDQASAEQAAQGSPWTAEPWLVSASGVAGR